MNSARSPLPYDRVNAYERLLNSFATAVEEAGGEVRVPDVPLSNCFTSRGSAGVEFKRCLYLRDCPCRRKPTGVRMDIAVSVLEEITPDIWSLDRSTVYINYFLVADRKAHLAQALHYDFVREGQEQHPFFHAHLTAQLVCLSEFHDTDLGVDRREGAPETPIGARIPTSDMTIASVLYCLAADHLEPAIFEKFAKEVRAIEDRLPMLRFDALKASLEGNRDHFKSSHWFAHTLEKAQVVAYAGTQTPGRRQKREGKRPIPPNKAKPGR
ncbi:MAG TPA: hypothetical protein VN893_13900 [Bryobacteraceae bacterium]|nr:hypothetical protein [Bryobacteraceae bacterium]